MNPAGQSLDEHKTNKNTHALFDQSRYLDPRDSISKRRRSLLIIHFSPYSSCPKYHYLFVICYCLSLAVPSWLSCCACVFFFFFLCACVGCRRVRGRIACIYKTSDVFLFILHAAVECQVNMDPKGVGYTRLLSDCDLSTKLNDLQAELYAV